MTTEGEALLEKAKSLPTGDQVHIGIALTRENPEAVREMNGLEQTLTDRLDGPFKPIPENWVEQIVEKSAALSDED